MEIEVMHGDIPQIQRELVLDRFKKGRIQVLAATDVASRGLDIPNVDLVVQTEPPVETETYIHRSGRTARAGNRGICITLYSNRKHDQNLYDIELRAGINVKRLTYPFDPSQLPPPKEYV